MLAGIPEDRMPKGPGVGIVTFGGGNGVLAADQAAEYGLATPMLDPACVDRLRPLLVSVASAANPVDLTPTTAFRPEALARLPEAFDVLAEDENLHSLMFIIASLGSKAQEIGDIIIDLQRRSPKPVCVCWASPPKGAIERLAEHGIATFVEPARGMRALGRLVRRHDALARPERAAPNPVAVDWSRFVRVGDKVVTEDRCHALMKEAGLAVASGGLARTAEEAVSISREIGFPVVLKGISPSVTHRAAAGLLSVDLRTEQDVEAAFARLSERARSIGVRMDGFYVQGMAKGGSELLVAGFRDPLFGPMVTVGVGGGLTETINDVVTQPAPVSEAGAAAMIARLRSHARMAPDGDEGGAAAFVARFSQLCLGAPWKAFTFEVNPIKWTARSAIAVDGLLIIEAE
jgi:acyl-CoA synthetase (NDP forming)